MYLGNNLCPDYMKNPPNLLMSNEIKQPNLKRGQKKKKRLIMQRVGAVVEEQELFCTTGGSTKWYNYFGKQFGSSLKFKNMHTM